MTGEGTGVSPSRLSVTGRSYTSFHDYAEPEDKATKVAIRVVLMTEQEVQYSWYAVGTRHQHEKVQAITLDDRMRHDRSLVCQARLTRTM